MQLRFWLVALLLILSGTWIQAQENSGAPDASKIIVISIDDFTVNITGEAGAVFQSAQVAVRNVYTGETTFSQANFDGSFSAEISGTPHMVYQVNAARVYPLNERGTDDTLPGVGTVVYQPPAQQANQPTNFESGGLLSYGAAQWYASGRIGQLDYQPGERLVLALDIVMRLPASDLSLNYGMGGTLALRRLFDASGQQVSTAQGAGEGWSSRLTETGLPIMGITEPDIVIEETMTNRIYRNEESSELRFSLSLTAPLNVPPGIYGAVFSGQSTIADSQPFDWYANRVFSTTGTGTEGKSETLLPLLLHIGEVAEPRITLSIFDRTATEDSAQTADLTQHTPPVTVRQPGTAALSLRILGAVLPVMLLQPDTLNGEITQPDGSTQTINSPTQIIMIDGIPHLAAPQWDFSRYGDYMLRLTTTLRDTAANRYQSGGHYAVTIAEPLTLYPSLLAGTPFNASTDIPFSMRIAPPFPADITQTVVIPGQAPMSITGQANRYGEYRGESARLNVGEYRIDTSARYTDSEGRLWAGSVRAAGAVTASTVQGVRGLADYSRQPQAWFDTAFYPVDAPEVLPIVNFPFFSGDIVYLSDTAGINPVLGETDDYAYLSVITPGAVLRQFVGGGAVDARLNGIGSEYAFLFGTTVQGGYASVTVRSQGDSARVMPPFTAPLLDNQLMFVSLTGTRPGSVLEIGSPITTAGYILPPVAADITAAITAPSGETIIETTANPYGFFSTPDSVLLDEIGLWRVNLEAQYTGQTSAAALIEPVRGGLLGVSEYFVFVVAADAPLLETNRAGMTAFAAGQPITLNLGAPQEWENVRAYYVIETPERIIEQGELSVFSNQANYTLTADTEPVTLSFLMTGSEGQAAARVFTLRGNTLYTAGESE